MPLYNFVLKKILGAGLLITCIKISAEPVDSLYLALADSIDIIIAADGSGDYQTVQEAVDAVPDDNAERTILYIRNGTYKQKLLIPAAKTNITLIGQSVDSTILTYDDYSGRVVGSDTLGTSDSYSFALEADDFTAMNLTIENSAGDVGQAVALRSRGDRQSFLHCRLAGYQDTYYTYGSQRNFLKDCQVIGAIDYIFGSTTIIFDSCQIHSLRENSYITAASTPENVRFGYVFFNCRLTAAFGRTGIYLGRPWRPYAQTVYYKCDEGSFLNKAGWSIWNGNNNHLTCFYAEYQCFGAGSDTTNRASWSHQLTDEQAASYVMDTIFAASTSPEFGGDWLPDFGSDYYFNTMSRYTTKFMDSVNYNASITSISCNGEPIANFSPDIFKYGVELPEGTTDIPVLTADMEDSLATYTVSYPGILPYPATIVGTARDRGTNLAYTIYLSVDSAYNNAKLKLLRYNGVTVPDFDPDIYNYTVELAPTTSSVPNIAAYTEISQATRVITYPESLPGTAFVDVTAADGVSTAQYSIDFTFASGLDAMKNPGNNFLITNPFNDKLIIRYTGTYTGNIEIGLYSIQGRLVTSKKINLATIQNGTFVLDTGSTPDGYYIVRIMEQRSVNTTKVTKMSY